MFLFSPPSLAQFRYTYTGKARKKMGSARGWGRLSKASKMERKRSQGVEGGHNNDPWNSRQITKQRQI